MNPDGPHAGDPLIDLTSDTLACNVHGTTGVPRVASVKDGATLTFEWHSWADDKSKPVLDPGHLGPGAIYMKKVDSAINDSGAGNGWFKLWDEIYDASTQEWYTTKLIRNNGLMSIALPKGLKGGYYLVRPELLSLHQALDGQPQFYAGCAQIFLESSGDLGPAETVSIPGYVKSSDANMNWNIYYGQNNADYPQVGPKVATLVSSSSVQSQSSQSEGFKPAGCILQSGSSWCGVEVPSYTDEAGCWSSTQNCWDQNQNCWSSAPATGGASCKIWEAKCQAISDGCNSGSFNGPPNKGKVLDPAPSTIALAGVIQPSLAVGAGSDNSGSASPQPTEAAAEAPASSAEGQSYEQPAYTPVPVASSTAEQKPAPAPATTPAPKVPDSYKGAKVKFVTVYTTEEVTEYKYVTVYNKHKRTHLRRRPVHH